jgi:hypothetical protein
MLILGMGAGVLLLRRMRRVRGGAEGMSLYANYAAIGIAFVILVLPYRLMWQNELEVAFYQNQRCYALAENGPSVLLYCPASDVPRTKKVSQLDSALRRSGRFENLYTRPTLPAS